MLVLERKPDESIVIGGDILVTVLSVKADKVKIGVAAATDIPVHRAEVADRIARRDPRKSVPWVSPHRDDSVRYRNALHLVLGRVGTWGAAGATATFTASELRQIERALTGEMEARP
jgi:carbon storage regulator